MPRILNQKVKNQKNNDEVTFNFLSDLPLTAAQEKQVRFGHKGIADNLKRIILKCHTPFTIGLFAKWGTGKTTIIKILENKMQEEDIACAIFDVWKHEKDSLRGIFLKEIVKQLRKKDKLAESFELSKRLDTTISREIQSRFWDKSRWGYVTFFLCIVVRVGAGIYDLWPQHFGNYVSIMLSGSFVSSFVIWMLNQTLISEKTTTTMDRFRDPHQFEGEFKRIINNISSNKFLVIIDNLDRTTHGRAVQLLSTIKTFLEQNKCIFLIACDDEAIKKHLESIYIPRYIQSSDEADNKTPFDADEFLRKFFNAFLRIPDFINTELQTYTEHLLKKTNVHQLDSSDVAYVITSAFRDNPRQIKQFINALLARFLLAQERESEPEPLIVPKGTVTDHVAFLAKFLVIRQKFPKEYEETIKSHLMTVEEIERITTEKEKLRDFLRATKAVTTRDIRPFHYLKQSEEELAIPGIEALEIALLDGNVDLVKEKIEVMKDNNEQVEIFNKIIINLIDRNWYRLIPLYNIVSSSLTALQYCGLNLDRHFYDKISDSLNDDKILGPKLESIEPSLIFDGLLTKCNIKDRNGIIDRYLDILSKQEKSEK